MQTSPLLACLGRIFPALHIWVYERMDNSYICMYLCYLCIYKQGGYAKKEDWG